MEHQEEEPSDVVFIDCFVVVFVLVCGPLFNLNQLGQVCESFASLFLSVFICVSNSNTYSCCLLLVILCHNGFYAGIINLLLSCCIVLVVHPSDDLIHWDQHVSLFLVFLFSVWCVFNAVLLHLVIGCCIFCLLFCCIVLVVHPFCNVIGWDHMVIHLHHYFCCFCLVFLFHPSNSNTSSCCKFVSNFIMQ